MAGRAVAALLWRVVFLSLWLPDAVAALLWHPRAAEYLLSHLKQFHCHFVYRFVVYSTRKTILPEETDRTGLSAVFTRTTVEAEEEEEMIKYFISLRILLWFSCWVSNLF